MQDEVLQDSVVMQGVTSSECIIYYVHLDLGQIPTAVFSKLSTAYRVFQMMRPHGCIVLQSCYVSNFPISPGSLSP